MSENENKLENLDNIFTKNVIQVTDEKSTVDIFWDTTDTPETAAFVHKNNMKILAMCIGRMIDDVGVRNIVLYDVAAHGDWEKSTIDSIYCIGSSNKLLTLYYIALGKINMKPQQLIELKSFRINAIDAAITFDGEWVLNNSSNIFSLKTEDVPWIFYITYAGKLYRKYGTAAAELTAENVKLVAAERGYSPQGPLELNSDQGLVVTYLKNNGELVYRSYAFASATGQKEWFSEEVIDTFNPNQVQNISIHRLNDYRMGICVSLIENEKYKNLWYISDRSYAQMAFRPEKFFISNAVIHNPVYGYVNYDENNETLIQPKWDWSINEEHDIVTLTSDLPLVFYNGYEKIVVANGTAEKPLFTTNADFAIYKIAVDKENNCIKIYFPQKLRRSFTVTLNPTSSLDFAAQINCNSGGGLVTVTASASHLFDITNVISYNYNENFKIGNPIINLISAEMHYITETKFKIAPEKILYF